MSEELLATEIKTWEIVSGQLKLLETSLVQEGKMESFSGQIGLQKNDFLRQVVGYRYPNNPWEKDSYFIRPEYRSLVEKVLVSLNSEVAHVEDD